MVIAEAESHSFDDFDFVVDAFEHTGVQTLGSISAD